MTTLLVQIEECLNSRPLCPLSDDPSDLSAITPAHFLIGEPTLTVPQPSLMETPTSKLQRWQLLRRMYEDFWARWSSEYLSELQHRTKWRTPKPQPKIGDLCLLRSELQPPCKWSLARIIAVRLGDGGYVREVTVRTATTTLTRNITKISVMPIQDENSPQAGECSGINQERDTTMLSLLPHVPNSSHTFTTVYIFHTLYT